MLVNLVKNFRPQIVEVAHGQEETIYEMMLYYYVTHGMSHAEAEACVKAYLDKIEAITFK